MLLLYVDSGDDFTAAVVVLFAATVLVVGGGSLVSLTWELRQYSAVLGLPVAFIYSVIPTAGVLISIYAIAATTGAITVDSETAADSGT